MTIVRRTLATVLAIVLFTSVAALAIASPPAGNPAAWLAMLPASPHGDPHGTAGRPAGGGTMDPDRHRVLDPRMGRDHHR